MRRPSRVLFIGLICIACWVVSADAGQEESKARRYRPSRDVVDTNEARQSIRAIYRALAEQHGIRVVFDPKLKDQKVQLNIEGLTLEEALELLGQTAGHFRQETEEGVWLIAEDTPQNRRSYEEQTLQAFSLENIALKDAMTLLRSLLGLKYIAAHEDLQLLVVRDNAEKVALVADLLGRIDKPRAEVEVAVELWHLSPAARKKLAGLWSDSAGDSAVRVKANVLQELRHQGRRLAAPSLRTLEGEEASVLLQDELSLDAGSGGVSYLTLGLTLDVEPKVHRLSNEITLEMDLAFSDLTDGVQLPDQLGPAVGSRRLENNMRLAQGESYVVRGLLQTGKGKQTFLSSLLAEEGGSGEIVLILTPRIVRPSGLTEEDLQAVCVGTETALGLCR